MTLDGSPKKQPVGSPKPVSTRTAQYGNNLRITVAANQGGRKYMEDRVQIENFRDEDGTILFTFLGVYDGHGGFQASEFVRQHLMNNIIHHETFESKDDDEVLEAIRHGFLTTHHQMRKVVDTWPRTASGYSSTAGTTCSVAIIMNGKIYTGHVGDSAVILGKRTEETPNQLVAERLTVDHKPESEDEHARIQLAGGQVMVKGGVNRVVWTRPLRGHHGPVRRSTPTENIPFLAVARSLGDLWSYCEVTGEFIVSPDPDLAVREITESDMCMVLASDGLTNVLAPMQVTMIVDDEDEITKRYAQGRENDCLRRTARTKYGNHARALLSNAMKNWRQFRADNISAICVIFDPPLTELGDEEPAVEQTFSTHQSIDEIFCLDPECMIRIAPEGSQKLATYRTPLVYTGSMDPNFCCVDYRGPGFITHEEEEYLEARFVAKADMTPVRQLFQPDDLPEVEPVSIPASFPPEGPEDKVASLRTPEKKTTVSPTLRYSSRSIRKVTPVDRDVLDEVRLSAKKMRSAMNNAENIVETTELSVKTEEKEVTESDEEDSGSTGGGSNTSVATVTSEEPTMSTPRAATPSSRTASAKAAQSAVTRRVTRSGKALGTNLTTSEPRRPIAIAVRQSATTTPSTRNGKVTRTPGSSTIMKISVEERETESVGVVTRSRDRRTTVLVNLESPVASAGPSARTPFRTPSTSNGMIFSEKGSRKRPRQSVINGSGVTPFVQRMSIEDRKNSRQQVEYPRIRSAPTTPEKASDSPSRMGSKWSLSKLDAARGDAEPLDEEPPSKMRRIYGFVRRLVGLGKHD